jgi:hypothetical protein
MNFDTLEISHDLQERGFTPAQAEGIIELAMSQNANAVTKDFLKVELSEIKCELQANIVQTKSELEVKISDTKNELKSEVGELRFELKVGLDKKSFEIEGIKSELKSLEVLIINTKVDIIRWMIAVYLVTLGTFFTFMKLFR